MKHKILAALTAFSMLCGMTAVPELCITAQAETQFLAFQNGELVLSGPINDTLTYTIGEDGTLTISGTGALPDNWLSPLLPNNASSWRIDFQEPVRSIVIAPGVTAIGSGAFESFKNVTTVSIPDPVTSIGGMAFCNCPLLREVQIPDSVTKLGAYAFAYCTSLTSVTVPESCRTIRDHAFSGCTALRDVTIPESAEIGSMILSDTPWLQAQQAQDPLVLLNGTVQDGKLCVGEVVIPEGTHLISTGAFTGCTDLTAVTIPESIDRIPEYTFTNCTSLQSVTILNPYCTIAVVYGDNSGYPPVPDSRTICNRVKHDDTMFNGWDRYEVTYTGVIRSYEGSAAQKFAEEYGYAFESLGAPPELAPGNVNGDAAINASDAAAVLIAAAAIGVDQDSGLNTAQLSAADVNHDNAVNASDAAIILVYAAALGAGDTDAKITDFIK